jgi:hypothetical protein
VDFIGLQQDHGGGMFALAYCGIGKRSEMVEDAGAIKPYADGTLLFTIQPVIQLFRIFAPILFFFQSRIH